MTSSVAARCRSNDATHAISAPKTTPITGPTNVFQAAPVRTSSTEAAQDSTTGKDTMAMNGTMDIAGFQSPPSRGVRTTLAVRAISTHANASMSARSNKWSLALRISSGVSLSAIPTRTTFAVDAARASPGARPTALPAV